MKTTNSNSNSNSNSAKNVKKGANLYQQRLSGHMEFEKSLSRAWARVFSNPAIVFALPFAKDDTKAFKDFAAYMKKRHDTNDTPARGWSIYYAYQYAESKIKEYAKGGNVAAQNYRKNGKSEILDILK